MAFKKDTYNQKAAEDPAAHFKTLTKRQFPDVMPHQKEILEQYATAHEKTCDIALQLPTGSGKTLVGLLIADWRRLKLKERVIYLCPTRQLVQQTVTQARDQYGIDAIDLSGKKDNFLPAAQTAYKTGSAIAVTTYSGLFNTNPFFDDPNLIVVDDTHSAENYIAAMWSLNIHSGTVLHAALAEYLRPHVKPQEHSRLVGEWSDPSDSTWVEKLPTTLADEISSDLVSLIDAHAGRDNPDIHFSWSVLREHLDACHIYLSSNEILIRPLIPPTSTHKPFAAATQRLYMSATLGGGGDLERLTGRQNIERLPAPTDFQMAGVGRRFFIFPSLSLTEEGTAALTVKLQQRAGRSVVLTTSSSQADAQIDVVKSELEDFKVYDKNDIENDKTPFVKSANAVAVLANRYDGIDFPGNECRLLCLIDLPKATNSQERFIMTKMGAAELYNERIQARVLQATGRCTRALQDRSAVLITGTELVDFLADKRKWIYLHPELQSELEFGVNQSTGIVENDILENFESFISNSAEWSKADSMIRDAVCNYEQTSFPGMEDLSRSAPFEVAYQDAVWHGDFAGAFRLGRDVLGSLNHATLRGYRGLWHYLTGAIALRIANDSQDVYVKAAHKHFSSAKKAAPYVSWLNSLTQPTKHDSEENEHASVEVIKQAESLEQLFSSMGAATNYKFEKKAQSVLEKLSNEATFEEAQVELGSLLGFTAGNSEDDAAPDPWWLGYTHGIVFESHAGGDPDTIFGANKARQASSHPKWLRKNLDGAEQINITSILVTPCTRASSGADPQLGEVLYWRLDRFREWANRAIGVLREMKGAFPGEGDLFWRQQASERLVQEGLDMQSLTERLTLANEAMEIVG